MGTKQPSEVFVKVVTSKNTLKKGKSGGVLVSGGLRPLFVLHRLYNPFFSFALVYETVLCFLHKGTWESWGIKCPRQNQFSARKREVPGWRSIRWQSKLSNGWNSDLFKKDSYTAKSWSPFVPEALDYLIVQWRISEQILSMELFLWNTSKVLKIYLLRNGI